MVGALHERPRPGAARLLTERQASEVVAMVCAPPPEGRGRWTVRLIAQEAVRRGFVAKVGRETVRELLLRHDLKPWREMWCVPELDTQYIERMEDVLELYARPLCPAEPVVCFDERPVQLLEWVRPASSACPGREARQDYAYFRCGTANLFCAVAPKAGWHFVKATPNRKSEAFAEALRDIASQCPDAETIHLVLDNLSTHSCRALRELLDHVVVLNEAHARRLLREYQRYYNASRTHLSLGKDAPERREVQGSEHGAKVIELREVFGLHHRYERRAA
ncbi:hypothetical protein BHS05_08905 [Myxococcus xanthus]|nr:hypothetical protein BHS05_08905 [Myxococcus xanthus]